MKRIAITIILLIGLCFSASAESGRRGSSSPFAYNGFMGGMMLHAGYVSQGNVTIGNQSQRLRGIPLGIGGALKIRLGDHLRVGTEGYTSSVGYGDWGSAVSIGWGGLLVDLCVRFGEWTPYAGVTVGGGVVENLTLTSTPALDFEPEEQLSYRHYGVGVVTPFMGVEYTLTDRMALTLKTDYILPIGTTESDFPGGVRCYLGFLFSH